MEEQAEVDGTGRVIAQSRLGELGKHTQLQVQGAMLRLWAVRGRQGEVLSENVTRRKLPDGTAVEVDLGGVVIKLRVGHGDQHEFIVPLQSLNIGGPEPTVHEAPTGRGWKSAERSTDAPAGITAGTGSSPDEPADLHRSPNMGESPHRAVAAQGRAIAPGGPAAHAGAPRPRADQPVAAPAAILTPGSLRGRVPGAPAEAAAFAKRLDAIKSATDAACTARHG